MSLFAEAARKAAKVRFKQPQLDAEGQEVEVGCTHGPFTHDFCMYNSAAALCATLVYFCGDVRYCHCCNSIEGVL